MPELPFLAQGARVGRLVRRLALLLMLSAIAHGTLGAQTTKTATAPVVTAAFLINFVKFVDWPSDVLPPEAPIVMCLADAPVLEAVSRALSNRPATARSITIVAVQPSAVPDACAVLYVGDLNVRAMSAVIAALKGRSVLAVSDSTDFARHGGTIQLFLQDGRMRFSVNPKAAERARLHVSSLLLELAVIVKE
jgi:YfiR/HmsC-like